MESYYDKVGAHYLEKSKAYFSICTLSIDLCSDGASLNEVVALNMAKAVEYAFRYILYCEGFDFPYDQYVWQLLEVIVRHNLIEEPISKFIGVQCLSDWKESVSDVIPATTKDLRECEAKLKILYTYIENKYGTRGELAVNIQERCLDYLPKDLDKLPYADKVRAMLPVYLRFRDILGAAEGGVTQNEAE